MHQHSLEAFRAIASELPKKRKEVFEAIYVCPGSTYCWNHEPELILVYLGHNWSGNGYWHQFARVGDHSRGVWCEITDKEIPLMRKTHTPPQDKE